MSRSETHNPSRIISGGQTGVDRAALDVAITLGIPHGGWCPRGRLAEDGRIPDRYRLEEMATADYAPRTERNIVDADGTIILHRGRLRGGTLLTHQMAQRHDKPCLTVDLDKPADPNVARDWLRANDVRILNVAGPRESQSPGIGDEAKRYLTGMLDA
ncbi:MAG TPA: molybdenum cofactor carrier [Planctomycetaceae bacterium]|nr:molybdenum cofactor carrier [Planctomycetaceae bacterium]